MLNFQLEQDGEGRGLKTKRQMVRQLMGHIIAALKSGRTFEQMAERLKDSGFPIESSTLKSYYYKCKADAATYKAAEREAGQILKNKNYLDTQREVMKQPHQSTIERIWLEVVIRRLETKGVEFYVGCKSTKKWLSGDALLEFLDDPDLYMAKVHNVRKEDYVAFKNDIPLHCQSITRNGRQCRNFVSGGAGDVDLETYARLRGGYCTVHGKCA